MARVLGDVSRRRADLVASLVLALLPLALLGRALLPGVVLSPADTLLEAYPWRALAPGVVPANPSMTDVTAQFHPWAIYAGREIGQGRFPLWNPYAYTGAPFFANPQTAVLFPLTALAYLLPPATAVTLASILKLGAAGLAMYWFLRVLSVGVLPATVAALTFMLNGRLLVFLQWPASSPIIFLPLLLGIVERLREGSRVRWMGALAVAVALLVFAGYPQGALIDLLVATAWAASRARAAPRRVGFVLGYAAGIFLGTLLAAVHLVPFLEYWHASSVFAYRAEWTPALSLPLRSAITFLMPHYYGTPSGRNFWGDFNFNEISVTVGVVPWLVLPAALLGAWGRGGPRFFIGLTAVAAAVRYGAPGSAVLMDLPVLSWLTPLGLTAPLLVFALSALCGLGLDRSGTVVSTADRLLQTAVHAVFLALVAIPLWFIFDDYATLVRTRIEVGVIVEYLGFLLLLALAAFAYLRWLRGRGRDRRWLLALGGVQLLSLLPLAVTANPVVDRRWFYPPTPAIQHLQRQVARDHGRVLLGYNVALLYGLSDVAGYDAMTPRRIERLAGPIGPPGSFGAFGSEPLLPATVFASPVFDLLGIRYIVSPPTAPSPGPHLALDYAGPDARVYRNERAFPRAFLVPGGRCIDDDAAVRRLLARDVNFREEVLLADCETAPAAGPGSGGGVAIRTYDPERVVIRAASAAPTYLVLTDTWFPGWRVWVDGEERRLWRANHAFRAAWLGPGEHEVVFEYRPGSVRAGLAVSVLGASVVAGLLVTAARSRAK